jgi:hypothetical protein
MARAPRHSHWLSFTSAHTGSSHRTHEGDQSGEKERGGYRRVRRGDFAMRLVARRLALRSVPRRALCTAPAVAAALPATLERLNVPAGAVPADTDSAVVLRRLNFLELLGVPDVAGALEREPGLLSRDLPAEATPRLHYLLNLGCARLGPMVGTAPQLLSCDLTTDLHRKVAILHALGVKRTGNWLQRNPRLVELDVERDMRPPIDFLRSIPNVDIGRVVDKLPMGIFGKEEQLRERVSFLEEELGVSPRYRVGRLISRWPHVLVYNLDEVVRPKVNAEAEPLAKAAPLPLRSARARASHARVRPARMRTTVAGGGREASP